MKQEDKETLLQDLCSRLPYGVKCAYFNTKDEMKVGELLTVWCKEKRVFIDKLSIDYDGGDCIGITPYLFPMSSMTNEQKREYHQSTSKDIDMLQDVILERINGKDNADKHSIAYHGIDWLNAHHFDYRGLIEKGLAVDATGLNIY